MDLSGVTFCDSGDLNALLAAHRIAASNGTALALACVPPVLRRVLEMTGVDQLPAVHDTVAEAVAVLEGGLHRDRNATA
ncbi:STAS domain-containing protein [Streptomyces sp. NPDC007856]|uniref:STAS domain-containing protein n=1 Tax=Streptomyces sp. NPDC007856 TaxID=3364781 RepID=UPI00369C2979